MIPIGDSRGRIVGFGARTLASDVEPKYLNSPETRLFDKGTLVYNFARARASAFERNELIVVEGYMDVISLYQAGFANVVATLGTAFTERQMAQLWQLAPEPVICFDGDRAGEAAAYRAIDRMLPVLREGHSFRFAFMPKDMDPDDLVRVEGPQAFSACLARAKPLIDAFWTRELSGRTLDTPERRAALEQDFEQRLALIGNVRVRDHYRRELKNRLWQLWRARPSGRQQTSVTVAGFGSAAPPAIAVNQFGREALLVLACLTHPWLIERFAEELSALHLRHSRLAALLAEAMDIVGERHGLDREALEAALAETPHAALLEQLRAQSGHARVGFARPETARLEVGAQFGQFLFLWKDMPALRQELDQAAAGLAEASEAEFERFMALQEQVASAEVQHPEDTHERDSLKRFEETVARLRKERSAALRGRRSLHQS
jgi:DNA primase